MKDTISLVMISDIGNVLKDEKPDYVVAYQNQLFSIKPLPLVLKNKQDFEGEVAYDYDKLNTTNKENCMEIKRTFTKQKNELYKQEMRPYFKKKIKYH